MANETKSYWVTILIVLMVLGFGGTIWMLGKAIDTRFDQLSAKIDVSTTSIVNSIETLKPAEAPGPVPSEPPPAAEGAKAAAPKEAPGKDAPPVKADKK